MAASLEELKIEMETDVVIQQSNLSQTARGLVFGYGNSRAQTVLIGEAPGQSEDQQGRPFVGAAGKFLETCLQACNLSRKDVYITNLVKFRPPNNRDPSEAEKALHIPYLRQELFLIQPQRIITLGRHAGRYFIPTLNLRTDHGQLKRVIKLGASEVDVFPFYHPAAALYNPSLKQTILIDFQKVFN